MRVVLKYEASHYIKAEGWPIVLTKCAECGTSILPRDWFDHEGRCDTCYMKRRSEVDEGR